MTSTMIEERVLLRMRGGPPWGIGVEGNPPGPVYVSRLRQRSSGKEQQIRLGDEVVSINGRNVEGMPGNVAMSIVDNSVGVLELEVMRKRYEDGPGNDFTSTAYSQPKIQPQPQPQSYHQPQVYQPQPTYQQPYQSQPPAPYQPTHYTPQPTSPPQQPYQNQPYTQSRYQAQQPAYQESHSSIQTRPPAPATNGYMVERRPSHTMQVTHGDDKDNGGGLKVKKKTTTTTRVLTKTGGDKSERTVTKTVTEKVGNKETTTTTTESSANDGYMEESGPRSVVKETRFTDEPVENLMVVAPETAECITGTPSRAGRSVRPVTREPAPAGRKVQPKQYIRPAGNNRSQQGYIEEYDAVDGRRKIVLTQPTSWAPHSDNAPSIQTYPRTVPQQRGQATPPSYSSSPAHTPKSYPSSTAYSPTPYHPSTAATPSGAKYAHVQPPVSPHPPASRPSASYPSQTERPNTRPHYLPPIHFDEGPEAPTYQTAPQTHAPRSSTLPRQAGHVTRTEIQPRHHAPPSQASQAKPQPSGYSTFPRRSQPQPMYSKSHLPSSQQQPQGYAPQSAYTPAQPRSAVPKPTVKKVIQVPVSNQLQGRPQSVDIGYKQGLPPTRAKPSRPGSAPQVQQKPTRYVPRDTYSPHSGVVNTPSSGHQGLLTTVTPNTYGSPGVQHTTLPQSTPAYDRPTPGKVSSPYEIQTRPGKTTTPVMTKIQAAPRKAPPPTEPKPISYEEPAAPRPIPKPLQAPSAFRGPTKTSTEILKPMKAEAHLGPQQAVLQTAKGQPKVQTIVLPPAVTPGQEVSLSFNAPGLVRADSFSQDSGVPMTPSSDIGSGQLEHVIVPESGDMEERMMIDETEAAAKTVTPGFVRAQKKKRDLKSKEKKQKVVQRAKSFHGLPTRDKGAIEELSVKAQDKQKACKTIADILMFPMDKKLKGARMFAKQRKRSAKYTKETRGMNYDADFDEEELEEMIDGEEGYDDTDEPFDPMAQSLRRGISLPAGAVPIIPGMAGLHQSRGYPAGPGDESDEGMDVGQPGAPPPPSAPMAPPPPPPPPLPPPGGMKYNWRGKEIEATNFDINLKSKEKCDHKTPQEYKNIVRDMTSQTGRGAQMFARLRERSEQFVLDENTMKLPKPRPPSFKKDEPPVKSDNVSLSYIASQGTPGAQEEPTWAKKTPPWAGQQQKKKKPVPPPPKPKPKPRPPVPTQEEMDRFQPIRFSPSGSPAGSTSGASGDKNNYNSKPRGWTSPPNVAQAPRSVDPGNAEEFRSQPMVPGEQPRKGSDGFTDFNARPRGFHPSNFTPARAGMVE